MKIDLDGFTDVSSQKLPYFSESPCRNGSNFSSSATQFSQWKALLQCSVVQLQAVYLNVFTCMSVYYYDSAFR